MTDEIVVVSGLPRSGTSLLMQMLEAGGIPPFADRVRAADEDNPKGYFEYEPARRLAEDASWVEEVSGRVVKVISELLRHLPAKHTYRVVFVMRRIEEVLASQRRMLVRRGADPGTGPDDDRMRLVLLRHLDEVVGWLEDRENIRVLFVSYNQLFERAGEHVRRLNEFLGGGLDEEAMEAVIDPDLYRRRVPERRGPLS